MASLTMPVHTADIRPWMKRLVRVGYAAKGVLYLLIGGLALQLAFGQGGRLTDASGALRSLVGEPFGVAMLAAIGVGLLAYAAWEFSGVFWLPRLRPRQRRAWMQQAGSMVKSVGYGAVGWEALQLVMGARGSSGNNTDEYAREAMQLPLGRWALVAAGIGIAIYGIVQARNAWQARLGEDLDQSALRREGLGWVVNIGRAGIGARGVVFVAMGTLLVRAGFDRRPSEAGGIAEALGTLLTQPFGAALLAATSAGLVCFGVWQLLHARYARI
jgi:hypothetical protein